jgi:pimeloyl-ACP methyl ester carboxylesterase
MIATIDGRRIGYDDSGGDGVPLVLLHGFPLDRTVWDEQVEVLAGSRVVRVDLRGCGESEPSDGPALMESLAGDVAGLLDALDVTTAALVGHSIGGYVALAFFRMYAERVAGLALVASHVNADTPEGSKGRDALAERLERERSMDAAIATYLPRYFASGVYREHPEIVERVRAMIERQDPFGCAQLIRGMKARLGSADLLEDVHVPALVVAGGQDTYIDPDSLRETATAMRDATYVLLPEAGHLPLLESAERTADALADFAARVRDDAAR